MVIHTDRSERQTVGVVATGRSVSNRRRRRSSSKRRRRREEGRKQGREGGRMEEGGVQEQDEDDEGSHHNITGYSNIVRTPKHKRVLTFPITL